jgi:hypothetical protein
MKSMEMALVHGAIENSIMTFVSNPPDGKYQLGYLAALVDTLVDVGGKDYGEFLAMCCGKFQGEDD